MGHKFLNNRRHGFKGKKTLLRGIGFSNKKRYNFIADHSLYQFKN